MDSMQHITKKKIVHNVLGVTENVLCTSIQYTFVALLSIWPSPTNSVNTPHGEDMAVWSIIIEVSGMVTTMMLPVSGQAAKI